MNDRSTHRCRTCDSPLPEGMKSPFFPFCSTRCRMVDLGRWFSGDYKISEPLIEDMDEDQTDSKTGSYQE